MNEDDDKDDLTSIEDLGEFVHEDNTAINKKLAALNDPLSEEGLEGEADEFAVEAVEEEPQTDDLGADAADEEFTAAEADDEFATEAVKEEPQADDLGADVVDEEFTAAEGDDEFAAEAVEEELRTDEEFTVMEGDDKFATEAVGEEPQADEEFTAAEAGAGEEAPAPAEEVPAAPVDESLPTEESAPAGVDETRDLYSLAVRHIKPGEQTEAVRALLEEYGFLAKEGAELIEQGLVHGTVLVPRIAQYTAVVLAHRLSRLDLDVACALSENIHPTDSEGIDVV